MLPRKHPNNFVLCRVISKGTSKEKSVCAEQRDNCLNYYPLFLAVASALSCYTSEVSRTARAVLVPQYSTSYANCSADCDEMVGILSFVLHTIFSLRSFRDICRKTYIKIARMRPTCEFKMRFTKKKLRNRAWPSTTMMSSTSARPSEKY